MVIHEHVNCLVFITKKFTPRKEGQGEVTLLWHKKILSNGFVPPEGRDVPAPPLLGKSSLLSPFSTQRMVFTRLLLNTGKRHKPNSPSTSRTFSRLANWVSTEPGMTNIWDDERMEKGCAALSKDRQNTWTVISHFTITLKHGCDAYSPSLFDAPSRFSGDWIFLLANLIWLTWVLF